MAEQRIAIIDIGSNSVRLVVYERTVNGAHRVIDGSKRPARLSEHIDAAGKLKFQAIAQMIGTIQHFLMICSYHKTVHIRAVATAAIRNAVNGREVLAAIKAETGLDVELLTGEEEAYFGFLGMINALDISDGFLIDIGGGSTEVSLFRGRKLVRSVSFPFGCVSLNRRYSPQGSLDAQALKELELAVADAVSAEPWIAESPGLPLVGVGGTVRALGKIHQAVRNYPFASNHNYRIEAADTEELLERLLKLPFDKRRKFPGLSKDRTDVILPGLAVLQQLFRTMQASHYLVCGTGLRDGLFHATRFEDHPMLEDVLSFSIDNVQRLHSAASSLHVQFVEQAALQIFDTLEGIYALPHDSRLLLQTAARLFRIGASIDYYEAAKHSFYLIINSHLNGLTHRQIVLIAAIASYKGKGRLRQQLSEYRELLNENDLDTVTRLGVILLLAVALDRSETQNAWPLEVRLLPPTLLLSPADDSRPLSWEQTEVKELASDFKKAWSVTPELLA